MAYLALSNCRTGAARRRAGDRENAHSAGVTASRACKRPSAPRRTGKGPLGPGAFYRPAPDASSSRLRTLQHGRHPAGTTHAVGHRVAESGLVGHNGSVSDQLLHVLPVDDPRRPAIRRAVFGTLWASAFFLLFAATKEVKPLYSHAPWLNDPYDTVLSFTMFFVPLIVVCVLVQVNLCRRAEPLLASRVAAVLRGCRVAVGAIAIELLSGWVALALEANRSQWTGAATGVGISLLLLTSLVTMKVSVDLLRVPHLPKMSHVSGAEPADWLADAVKVVKRESHRLGPLEEAALVGLAWSEENLVREVRRHPVVAAAVTSGTFGVVVLGWQGYREGHFLSVTLLAMGLGFCAMFAFLVSAGSYFGLVRSTQPSYGLQRQAVDASVIACTAAVVTLAFRNYLFWMIGSTAAAAGPQQFATLVGSAAVLAFGVALSVEVLLRSHARSTL